ncbi:N-acetylmuramoyl-L-alanine amidase [Arcanobacterium phocae]|uniref:N-acetylmuramoyl-L-alanine amidase n=1 Tax=Arcanobacterium phocae TaxID=131112 RepID=UPI001C0E9B63|nr:N-acetylmuramoyl-L-alanine amidase [Arcanobacterium phocae]
MKNWEKVEADLDLILDKHFTVGRDGHKIDKIILHHNAGNLDAQGIYGTWQNRRASAHYQVDAEGTISQHVWDQHTAWSVLKWHANCTSLSIEHANNDFTVWTIWDKTLEEGAHLTAALCKFYGLGRPQWKKNVFGHNFFSPTACPGAIAGTQLGKYMERAQYWYDTMTGTTAPAPAPIPITIPEKTISQLADEVMAGVYGNGDARRNALGSKYEAVQAEINRRILGDPNRISNLADRAMAGEFGNGDQRRAALGGDYAAVQAEINRRYGI